MIRTYHTEEGEIVITSPDGVTTEKIIEVIANAYIEAGDLF